MCHQLPEGTRVVGMHHRGLWGVCGQGPRRALAEFRVDLSERDFYVLANLLFFVPRRDATITFEDITDDAVRYAAEGRQPFNRFLESFYNAPVRSNSLFLKHFFYVRGRGH
ncbi:MAG: hypothetical protein ACLU4N_19485 [Butyricimonas faecihominis]